MCDVIVRGAHRHLDKGLLVTLVNDGAYEIRSGSNLVLTAEAFDYVETKDALHAMVRRLSEFTVKPLIGLTRPELSNLQTN